MRRQTRHGVDGGWKTHSIVVNSPVLKEKLAEVFKTYPSVDTSIPELVFDGEFTPFVHRWPQLCKLRDEETDQDAKSLLDLLIETIHPEIEKDFAVLEHFEKTGSISFAQARLAFVPGDTIISQRSGVQSAGSLQDVQLVSDGQGSSYYSLLVETVDWNGHKFGVAEVGWILHPFKGNQQLVDLDIFPLRIHKAQEDIKRELTARGKQFEQLCGQHLRFYAGKATRLETESSPWGGYQRPTDFPVSILHSLSDQN